MTMNRIAVGTAACCVVMFVGACGGSTPATGIAGSAPTSAATGGGPGGGAVSGARDFPGASGLLAQIDGTTLQVQSAEAQTAVTYSAATTFTNTVVARLSDVLVGACVQARTAMPASGTGGPRPTADPNAINGPIVAASVEISPAVNGTCSALGGLRTAGVRSPGAAGGPTPSSGTPNPGRTRGTNGGGNGFGGNGFGGFGAFGKVTAVNGTSFTVESMRPQGGSTTPVVPTAQIVKTSATTKFTLTRAASAKALVVGLCVTAMGKASDTGSVAATAIMLRPAQNGSCSSGFGRRGPDGGPTPAGGGSGA